jgi:hypothetical protein
MTMTLNNKVQHDVITVQNNFFILLCNKNQLDAIFILSLFRQSTSTCFGYICSPSSGALLLHHCIVYNDMFYRIL